MHPREKGKALPLQDLLPLPCGREAALDVFHEAYLSQRSED
jgi:hypothetical protein